MDLGLDLMLEKLDREMKEITSSLSILTEDNQRYQQLLSDLNQAYNEFFVWLLLKDDAKNNPYYFKYVDIKYVEQILTKAGYIKEDKKASTR